MMYQKQNFQRDSSQIRLENHNMGGNSSARSEDVDKEVYNLNFVRLWSVIYF